MTAAIVATRAAADVAEARIALTHLRDSWVWLRDACEPGKATRLPARLVSEDEREIEAAQHRLDRYWAGIAVRAGRVPTQHADAARVGPVVARVTIARDLKALTERMWHHRTGAVLTWPTVTDPQARVLTVGCWYCSSNGQAWYPTPAGSVYGTCPDCHGAGERAANDACRVCSNVRACTCDRADAFVAASMRLLGIELDGRSVAQMPAREASRVLTRADRTARQASRTANLEIHLDTPCPACRFREMVAVCDVAGWAKATVECRRKLCACTGPGCRCGRPVRCEGRRHVWQAVEWNDLAARTRTRRAA